MQKSVNLFFLKQFTCSVHYSLYEWQPIYLMDMIYDFIIIYKKIVFFESLFKYFSYHVDFLFIYWLIVGNLWISKFTITVFVIGHNDSTEQLYRFDILRYTPIWCRLERPQSSKYIDNVLKMSHIRVSKILNISKYL